MTANNDIREKARRTGIKHWEIALHLGVSEQTFVRWLRTPLDSGKKQLINSAIDQLAAERAEVA